MEPFLGEVVLFAGNFAPRGWAFCDGQILPISQNQALFSILGTTYGGDGRTSFALPDLRGRAPIGPRQGPGLTNRTLGQRGGSETTTLNVNQIPPHTHIANINVSNSAGEEDNPTNNVLASHTGGFNEDATSGSLLKNSAPSSSTGGGQYHNNMPPFLAVNYIIAIVGVFPSRN